MKSAIQTGFRTVLFSGVTVGMVLWASGCGSSTSASGTEDTSTSGSVASVVGGGVNGSTSGGTQAMLEKQNYLDHVLNKLTPFSVADASSSCPTFSSSACGSALTYSDCSFSNSSATWNGSAAFACTGSLSTGTVQREVTATRTNAFGTGVAITSTGSLATYAGSVSGSGTTVTTSGGSITSVAIGGVKLVGTKSSGTEAFDHTITGTVTNSGGSYSGQVTTYHNLMHVTATSTFNAVTFSSGCCTPTGGSISTTFSGGGALRAGFVGITETLTFTGCGTANYQGPEGYSGAVTLANCI
jgi:hypothetical protein